MISRNQPKAMMNFSKLTQPETPNYFLSCPEGFSGFHPNEISPIFNVSHHQLCKAWTSMINKQPRVTMQCSNRAESHYQYVQRSRVFRFPDIIDVQFIPINKTTSTIAVFSRSKYGYSDFGVNQRRVERWLLKLGEIVGAMGSLD